MTLSKKQQREKDNSNNYIMSQTDVAVILKVSKQTIQVTEQRALKKIKEKLLNIYTKEEILESINLNNFPKSLP
jgi:DNA-binding XRE family transcriptional regulator